MPTGKQKEITTLRRMIEARGYKVVPSGSGHWKIQDKKGVFVRDENGPVILSSTSSETRSRAMSVKRLVDAGVLLSDPWAPTQPKDGDGADGDERDDAEKARAEREAELRRTDDQQRSERTRAVRERLEPVIARLGGWDKRGLVREVGVVAYYFATRAELQGAWASAEAAAENADSLRKGATLSPTIAAIWEQLLTELEAWPDTAARWMLLHREAKGLAPPSIGSPVIAAPAPVSTTPSATPRAIPAGTLPTLALRAAFEIGVGRSGDDPYRSQVLSLIEQIAQLEIDAMTRAPQQLALDEGDGDA